MQITCLGAAGGEVTGSSYLIQTDQARVLLDCGLFQGGKSSELLNRPPVNAKTALDAVLLTHGHLDHTGRLPLLSKIGYQGPIYATPATIEMTSLIVRDSARLQMQDAERDNRKRVRAGKKAVEPLYNSEQAETILSQLHPAPYQEKVTVAPGIEAIWAESGHMLGSASIQLLIEDQGAKKKVVFSGDLGPKGVPILRDYEPFKHADMVVLESTYGGRDHRPFQETVDEFARIVHEAVDNQGKILVPTFAVGRAQLIMTLLGWMFRHKQIRPFPVFLDSPMAAQALKIYQNHTELFDDEMLRYIKEKPWQEDFRSLKITITAEESKQLNDHPGPCLIMAGAGMCNAGRILHHLKANLWKPGTHVMIVGYQGYGSLGRRLVDGEKLVSIFGEKIAVKAQVHTLGGFSAHAGQTDLLGWFENLASTSPRVVLTHGEDQARKALAEKLKERFGIEPTLPALNEIVTL